MNNKFTQSTTSASKMRQPNQPGFGGRGPGGGGPIRGMMKGEKAKDFKGSVSKLLHYLKPFTVSLIIIFICAVLSTIFSVTGPLILGKATTLVVKGLSNIHANSGGIDFPSISKILLLLSLLYLISAFFSWFQGFLMSGVAMKVSASLRKDINSKIHRLPFSYFDAHTYGEVLSHITNDVDTVTQSLNQSIGQIITSFTSLVGIVFMMFFISWHMTLATLLVIPLSFLFVALIVGKSQPFFRSQQEGIAQVNAHIEEMYSTHLITKAFNAEQKAIEEFDYINNKLYSSVWKSQFFSGLMMPVMSFIGNLGYVAICILGGYLALSGKLSIGNIQAFIQYVRQFNHPITQVANTSNILQSMAAASERIFILLAEQEENQDEKELKEKNNGDRAQKNQLFLQNLSGKVEFSHVCFSYVPEKPIIHDFSAVAFPGQKVAIVGPTGSGKTTMVKLLMRFYDLDAGDILIDGVSEKSLSRETVRSCFGMVLQDTWLYNASILENIRYGNLLATEEEVHQAARMAQADNFIHTLPGGYSFVINEESNNISRGQKQLLTIARAFLANPRMLILDEATSSVDTLTEVLIQKAMDELMKGRTSFVIAHRLSTIQNSDLILVMRDGDIVEQGNHAELLAKKGFYCFLYESQFDSEEE